jgi:hypothetical protein
MLEIFEMFFEILFFREISYRVAEAGNLRCSKNLHRLGRQKTAVNHTSALLGPVFLLNCRNHLGQHLCTKWCQNGI